MSVFYYEKIIYLSLESCSSLDTGIHQVVDDDSSNATDKTGDGHAFFLVLEEQSDDWKNNADGAEPEAKDVEQRNPWEYETNQCNNETGNAEAIFVHVICHNSMPFFVSGATSSE